MFALVTPKGYHEGKAVPERVWPSLLRKAQSRSIKIEYNEVMRWAVGQLQFEVFQYRLENEYNAKITDGPHWNFLWQDG